MINCKDVQEQIRNKIKEETKELKSTPMLATILVGKDIASQKYVRNKEKFIASCGMNSFTMELEEDTTEKELLDMIEIFNSDKCVNGILVQLPLPEHINVQNIINAISIEKDIDGFKTNSPFTPCTPKGVISVLESLNYNVDGKHVLLLGRSNIVGKPLYNLLLSKNATIIQLHSKSPFPPQAYIYQFMPHLIISAVGQNGIIKGSMLERIKEMSDYSPEMIIDIGINNTEKGLEGDIVKNDYELLDKLNINYTTVPGVIGLMTVASLAKNLLKAYKLQGGQ